MPSAEITILNRKSTKKKSIDSPTVEMEIDPSATEIIQVRYTPANSNKLPIFRTASCLKAASFDAMNETIVPTW